MLVPSPLRMLDALRDEKCACRSRVHTMHFLEGTNVHSY
jgi:hypothetical protein